jgi:hypothetical protein
MKKQSDMHAPSGARESDSSITNIPAPLRNDSKPKGVLDHAHPGHLTRGAAESSTDPVEDSSQVSNSRGKKQP